MHDLCAGEIVMGKNEIDRRGALSSSQPILARTAKQKVLADALIADNRVVAIAAIKHNAARSEIFEIIVSAQTKHLHGKHIGHPEADAIIAVENVSDPDVVIVT